MRHWALSTWVTWTLVLSGCFGEIDFEESAPEGPSLEQFDIDPPASNEEPPIPTPDTWVPMTDDMGATVVPDDPIPGAYMTRRMTREQLAYTLDDVLGVTPEDALAPFPEEARTEGFTNSAVGLIVSDAYAQAHADLASAIAQQIPDWESLLSTHASCQDLQEVMCGESFVASLGAELFRRPLSSREIEDFARIFTSAQAEGLTFGEAAEYALEALVLAPQFIYFMENEGDAVSPREVTGYEMASRLSYLIWQSAPDDELYRAARDGELDAAAGVVHQAERMLGLHAQAKRATERFVRDWFALERLGALMRANVPDQLVADMLLGAVATYQRHVWESGAPLQSIFDTQTHMLTPALAAWYGLPSEGGGIRPYDLGGVPERGGILTHPGVLAAMSDRDVGGMVARGLFIMEDVQCKHPLEPPETLDLSAFTNHLGEEATEREYAEERAGDPSCGGCHAQFDPFAFALEPFDGVGRYATENAFGRALRTDGVVLLDASRKSYETTDEFVRMMAASTDVSMCLVHKHIQFAIGHHLTSADALAVAQVHRDFVHGGGDYEAMILAIVSNPIFRMARPKAGGSP